jgi:hypothetical protein
LRVIFLSATGESCAQASCAGEEGTSIHRYR